MIMNKEVFQEEVNKFLTDNGDDKVIFEDDIFIESNTFDADEIAEEVSLFLNELGLSSILVHDVTASDGNGNNYCLLENDDKIVGLVILDESFSEITLYK